MAEEKFFSEVCGLVKQYNSDIRELLDKAEKENTRKPESTEALKHLFAAVYAAAEKGLGQTPFPNRLWRRKPLPRVKS